MTAQEYMNSMRNALSSPYLYLHNPDSMYFGIEGHRRLAREVGYALNDFDGKEREDIINGSYSTIYVRACLLRPLLDADEWISIMLSQIKDKGGDE